jgi:hypothetical protein
MPCEILSARVGVKVERPQAFAGACQASRLELLPLSAFALCDADGALRLAL